MYDFKMAARGDGTDIAEWGGYVAQSKNGASCKLCRILVAAGYGDAPVTLWMGNTKSIIYSSMHELAKKTYSGGDSTPRLIKYAPYDR